MKHTVLFLLIVIFIDKIHLIEFNVFGNLTEKNDFGCNTQVILQCVVASNTSQLDWQVGKKPITATTDTAAECSKFSCSINPTVSSLYDFSYNETSGESNMTIKNVTLAEDGNQYKCDDGSGVTTPFDAVVQVPPVEETTQIASMNVSGNTPGTTQIIVSTGCVTLRTAALITFNWFTIRKNDSKKEAYEGEIREPSKDVSPCQIPSACISNDSVALSNNCTIEEDLDAPEVYFQVQILLRERELFTVNTSSTFKLKSLIPTSSSSTQNNWNITISTVNNTTTTASLQLQTTVSDGSFNSSDCCECCDCCDCDIKELFIVIAVAWTSALILTIVGSCILNYSLRKLDLCKCIFQLATLSWIFLLGVVLLYKGEKKWGVCLVSLLISLVLDAAFIGIDRYYVCLCENLCEIELLDHLWASFIYLMVSAVLSVLKYIILEDTKALQQKQEHEGITALEQTVAKHLSLGEKCCESDSAVSKSTLDLKQKEVRDKDKPLRASNTPEAPLSDTHEVPNSDTPKVPQSDTLKVPYCDRPEVSQSNTPVNNTKNKTRPLPRLNSRLGNEREHENSLTHVQLTQRAPLPPISSQERSKTGT